MSSTGLWAIEFRQRAQEVITSLIAARTDTGWVSCYENTFRMRALQAWSGNRIDGDSIIMKVLTRMKERGLGTIEEFEKVHSEIRGEWARESNSHRSWWEFFIPFIGKLADDMPRAASVTLLDAAFVFDKWGDVEGKLGPENVRHALAKGFLEVGQRPETCLSLTAEGVNSIHAWNSRYRGRRHQHSKADMRNGVVVSDAGGG